MRGQVRAVLEDDDVSLQPLSHRLLARTTLSLSNKSLPRYRKGRTTYRYHSMLVGKNTTRRRRMEVVDDGGVFAVLAQASCVGDVVRQDLNKTYKLQLANSQLSSSKYLIYRL